jgi:hypothetical protein
MEEGVNTQGRKNLFFSWEHNLETKISCLADHGFKFRNNACQPYVVGPIARHGC